MRGTIKLFISLNLLFGVSTHTTDAQILVPPPYLQSEDLMGHVLEGGCISCGAKCFQNTFITTESGTLSVGFEGVCVQAITDPLGVCRVCGITSTPVVNHWPSANGDY